MEGYIVIVQLGAGDLTIWDPRSIGQMNYFIWLFPGWWIVDNPTWVKAHNVVDEELVSKKSLMQKILNAILGFNGANGELHIDYKAFQNAISKKIEI